MTFDPTQHFTDLRGKKYLETKWRLVWFREEHPEGIIATELLQTEPVMIVKATIYAKEGEVLATGHGMCVIANGKVYSGRELEKAETAAIGRALAHAGYGTQFTEEDELSSLADSPVERRPNAASKPAQPVGGQQNAPAASWATEGDGGSNKPATAKGNGTTNNVAYKVYVEQVKAKDGNPKFTYILQRQNNSRIVVLWTGDPFRAVGLDPDQWKTHGNSVTLDPPLVVTVDGSKTTLAAYDPFAE